MGLLWLGLPLVLVYTKSMMGKPLGAVFLGRKRLSMGFLKFSGKRR
jgi:hypothetical protein